MFGNIDVKVRPIRIAYLVDPNDVEQVREAIRLSSSLWGGAYFPILPLHKRMPATWKDGPIKAPFAKDVALGYIEAFDPDVLVQFSRDVPAYITDLGLEIIKPKNIWELLDSEKHACPQYGLGIFELLNELFQEHFKYKQKYPIKIILPRIPDQLSLFWASWFGEIPPKLRPILEKNYFEPLEVEEMDLSPDKLGDLMKDDVLFTRRITGIGLNHRSRGGFRRDAYVYYFDATKVADVIDFWNLRASGKQVMPLPKQLKDDPNLREMLANFLKAHRRPWKHNPSVCDYASIIRGRSCTMDEVQDYAKTIKIDPENGGVSNDPYFSLQHWYPRIWDSWARDKDGANPSDIYGNEESSTEIGETKDLRFHFKPLLPKFADKYDYHGEPRCVNEVSFRFYGSEDYLAGVFPKSKGEDFTRAISGLTSFRGDWRIGKNGLIKLVKDDSVETREIPLAEKIVFAWLKDMGWNPQLSPPGILAKQIYRKLEGHSMTLRNKKLLGLLEYMNGGSVLANGNPDTKNIDKIHQERNLDVGEVKSRVGSSDLYEYLLSKGIFKLGLNTQCPRCLRNSWLSLDSISDSINCPKCQESFSAVGSISGGKWSYKTAGTFSIPKYADGAYAVLLALEFFDGHNSLSLRTTCTTSFTAIGPNKKTIEADYALFWEESVYGERQTGILFGESKTYGLFKKEDFDRMRYLAKCFPGAVLVFSTLRKALTKKEIAGITRIAKAGRKYWKPERPINPVLILTGTELLTYPGPPHCWDDPTRRKFDRTHGLIGLCDATQQMYLGLPSWQTSWNEKWEKRREQRKKKMRVQKAE